MKTRRYNINLSTDSEPIVTEPENILCGMQTVLKHAEDSELSDEFFARVKVPMNYLCRRLSLTPVQVVLLVVIMELSFQRKVTLDLISSYLNTNNLAILSKVADLNTLIALHLVKSQQNNRETSYSVPQGVMDAFRHNENYTHSLPILHNDSDLAECLDNMLIGLDDNPFDKDVDSFDTDVSDLIVANSHIHLAKTLLGAMKKTDKKEFRALLLMSMYWIRDEEVEIDCQRLQYVFDGHFEYKKVTAQIFSGNSALVKNKLVCVSSADGLMTRGTFSLTPKFRKALTPSRNTDNFEIGERSSQMLRHADIKPKTLFYNPDITDEVQRLHNILQPDNMAGILERMNERGLRGGFTCLLYGGPGTGKTETVLQVARNSGRDIFQVDVSKLRTKWYGESEKLVKGVFDDYRRMVKRSKVEPIIFFNEADAIFNRRMENAERSVDKGENALQNIILQEMETLDGILIATTNLATSLDPAFERRFLYKIHLDKPTVEVKAKIWQSMLPDLSDDESNQLAAEFDFSGGQIENVLRKRMVYELLTGDTIRFESLLAICQNEKIANKPISKCQDSIGFIRHAN